jgi:hypothetical protein
VAAAEVAKSFSQLNDLLGKAQHLYVIHGLAGKPKDGPPQGISGRGRR